MSRNLKNTLRYANIILVESDKQQKIRHLENIFPTPKSIKITNNSTKMLISISHSGCLVIVVDGNI